MREKYLNVLSQETEVIEKEIRTRVPLRATQYQYTLR